MTNLSSDVRLRAEVEAALEEALSRAELPLLSVDSEGVAFMSRGAQRMFARECSHETSADHLESSGATGLSAAITAAEVAFSQATGNWASTTETRIALADGSSLPLAIEVQSIEPGSIAGYVALIRDLRASRDAEDAVRRAEERFERLVESMITSVWLVRRKHVAYVNRAAAEMFGVERTLLIGANVAELFHAEDAGVLLANLGRIERGELVPPHEYRAIARDKTPLVIELSCVILEYEDEPTVLIFGRDVTERKREEQRLLQADRLSALGMLASGMAHAINNPLTYVLLNLDHLLRRLPGLAGDPLAITDVMARLAEAREGAERMATIVKRMRSFARTDETANRILDLRTVLESVLELVGHEVHHRGRLTTRFEDVPPVLANEAKIEQICLGLLLFAAQMLPDDAAKRHEVRLSLESDERKFAVLEIVCEGCDVGAINVDRLFDPFNSNDDGRALGIGLNVCSGLVEQLGGHIEAQVLPGTGLLLRTAIPCVPIQRVIESQRSIEPTSSLLPSAPGTARILVVDDDPGVGKALRLMLEGEHDVEALTCPREALRQLLSDSSYDLVFCDLMMPDLSGMDIYQVLRFNRPGYESKIVFMTGGAFSTSVRRFLAQVPNQRIEKPFNLRALQRIITKSIRRPG
ncbi:MAG TPA: PAS domain S-box protein [Polyangiaceae bacterium]